MTQACTGSPSCGAASPTPGAARIVCARSSSSSWRYLPKLETGSPLRRSRGSPSSTMGRTLMSRVYPASADGPEDRRRVAADGPYSPNVSGLSATLPDPGVPLPGDETDDPPVIEPVPPMPEAFVELAPPGVAVVPVVPLVGVVSP